MGDVKKGLRTVRNVVRNYNDAQVKVREATSNDPWGPAASLMADIADMTYNHLAFSDIMQMLWKRLNDNGKDWRHVYKALVVLDYIIKTGSDKVAQHCKENLYFIQTLQNFQYFEENKDHGMNVREKAKQVCVLLTDEEKLKNERVKASKTRERFQYGAPGGLFRADYGADDGGVSSPSQFGGSFNGSTSRSSHLPPEVEAVRPQTVNEEEIQLQIALAMSKEEADEEERRRQRDDVRLQIALSESESDYQKHKPVAVSSVNELFDVFNTPHPGGSSSSTGADPWGNDSFGSLPASRVPQTSASSQFDLNGLSSTSTLNDPWSSGPVITSSSPFGSSASTGHNGFGMSGPTTAATLNPWSSLQPSSASNSATTSPSNITGSSPKKNNHPIAQNFLGQNSALVDLDSLVTPVRPAATSSSAFMNPFTGPFSTPSGAMTSTPNNPFHQAAAPAPTINQLRNTNTMPYDSGPVLPQPLQPFGGMPAVTQPVPAPRFVQQPPAPANDNFNPFL